MSPGVPIRPITPARVAEQKEFYGQLRRSLRKEIKLLQNHQKGEHTQKIVTCDLCMERRSSITERVKAARMRA